MTIPELLELNYAATAEVESLTARLEDAHRYQRAVAHALEGAHQREANRLLVSLMRAENPPKREGNSGRRPGARKGANGHR